MPHLKKILFLLSLIISVIGSNEAVSQVPFSRGINLTGWFQSSNAGQIQFTGFTRKDLENIRSLGCDVIRLPVNMHGMTSGSPSYMFDPLYFNFLDSVVTWCEQLKIHLILDNHSFDPNIQTTPSIEDILQKVWTQMAQHYRDRSEYVIFEILNEPHGISTSDWGQIQGRIINTIRTIDPKHLIVVGGSGYNTYTELDKLPFYADTNLIYTFHFYDPFLFTHQGATWVSPSMEAVSGIPFPYCGACMPPLPAALKGTWVESNYNDYPAQGNDNYIRTLINYAINFRNTRHVKIYCGEFGVYIPNSNPAERIKWYSAVRQYLEENNIPWTTWDYKGGFGLFNKDSNELFENDLNVPLLEELNFNVPVQTPFTLRPDSVGFLIYSDYIGEKLYNESYTSGTIDFYSSDIPDNDRYSLAWKGFSQYNAIRLDMKPERDLSTLVSGGYAIDFMVRGDLPGIRFDVRFLDTKTGATDHPWRMGATIDENMTVGDRKWHHIHIPLSDFTERGSWDNNTWYNPEGKFDWKAVEKFEVSTEYAGTTGKQIWFDNILVTNLDTAIVRADDPLGIGEVRGIPDPGLKISPNPSDDISIISYTLDAGYHVRINILSMTGQPVRCLADENQLPGSQSVEWDGCYENGLRVPRGLYFVRFTASGISKVIKVIRN